MFKLTKHSAASSIIPSWNRCSLCKKRRQVELNELRAKHHLITISHCISENVRRNCWLFSMSIVCEQCLGEEKVSCAMSHHIKIDTWLGLMTVIQQIPPHSLASSATPTLSAQKIHVLPRQLCPSNSRKLLRNTSVCHRTWNNTNVSKRTTVWLYI